MWCNVVLLQDRVVGVPLYADGYKIPQQNERIGIYIAALHLFFLASIGFLVSIRCMPRSRVLLVCVWQVSGASSSHIWYTLCVCMCRATADPLIRCMPRSRVLLVCVWHVSGASSAHIWYTLCVYACVKPRPIHGYGVDLPNDEEHKMDQGIRAAVVAVVI